MENKSLFKAGANADVEAGKFGVAGGCNDERFRGGGRPEIGGEIEMRDPHAVILAFYSGSHVWPNAEGAARNR